MQVCAEITPFDLVKYEIDMESGYLKVDRAQRTSSLPAQVHGFIPQTCAGPWVAALMPGAKEGDHDPLDICALSERPLAELQNSIFTPRCATPLFHSAGTAAGGLVLVAGASHRELVGVVPQAVIAAGGGQLLVDAGRPENSFLLIKLLGPPAGAGSRMPLLGGFLTNEQVEAVARRILAGALPD